MKQRILLVMLAIITMTIQAQADDSGTFNTNFTWSYNEATKTLTISGEGRMMGSNKKQDLPFNDYRPYIETAVIEEGATSVGKNLFSDCTALKSVSIPNSVKEIYDKALQNCRSLTSIYIPAKVNYFGSQVFEGCISMESIVVDPENSKYESPDNCNAIVTVKTWSRYEHSLIYGCKNTVIPDWITHIYPYAFSNITSLKHINIPESVTHIMEKAFCNTGLTSIAIPNTVTTIANSAFTECEDLETVIIGDGIQYIEYNTFRNDRSLTTLVLGKNITDISSGAFENCEKLGSLTIPASVDDIDDDAFRNCHGLLSIVVEEGNKKYDSRNDCNALIDTEYNKLILACDNTVIPEGVVNIGELAFFNLYGLKSIHFPKSLILFYTLSFYNCPNVQSITVDEENPNLDSRNGCNAIISKDGNELLLGCNTTVIPNNVEKIQEHAFINCEHLKSITIPANVSELIKESFYHCMALTDIYCDAVKPPYASNAFADMDLGNITLHVPEGATKNYNKAPWSSFGKIVEMLSYTPGDANGDDELTKEDIYDIISFIKGKPIGEINEKAADVNGDGVVNITDVVMLIGIYNEQNK